MRNDCKARRNVEIAGVQRYHQMNGSRTDNYAYAGFKSNKYYTSDRFIQLDADFRRPDGKPLQGYGLEIELGCNGITNQTVLAEVMDKIVFAQFPQDLFKMQNDCSLSGATTAECITQVMTRQFIRNNYQAFRAMYDTYFPAFNIAANDSCGMHTNISLANFGKTAASQADAVRKLYYIINRHFEFCCALFNRKASATHYCGRMDYRGAKTMDLHSQCSSHAVCFNLGHYAEGRIELRLVGPQSSFGCFRNTMESVFFLVGAVKRLSWADCDDITKIFCGCNQYVFDRIKSKVRVAGQITDSQLAAIGATVVREDLV